MSIRNLFSAEKVNTGRQPAVDLCKTICIILMILCHVFYAVKYILTSKDAAKIVLMSAALVSLAGVMAHGMVDTVFFRPQIQILFWTYMAIFHAVTIKRAKLKQLRLLR